MPMVLNIVIIFSFLIKIMKALQMQYFRIFLEMVKIPMRNTTALISI